MSYTETARTRRSDAAYRPVPGMPYPDGITVETVPRVAPFSKEPTRLIFSPLSMKSKVMGWHNLLESRTCSSVDTAVFEDVLDTSAHFGENTALNWMMATEAIKQPDTLSRLTLAIREFYSITDVSAIGIEDRPGEKAVFVFLSSLRLSDDLLARLIDIEEVVQGRLSDIYLAFNYIPATALSAEDVAPSNTIWIKK